jgi:hypothetical protein
VGARIKREALEALWSESRDLRDRAWEVRVKVDETLREGKAVRQRIYFPGGRAERKPVRVLVES